MCVCAGYEFSVMTPSPSTTRCILFLSFFKKMCMGVLFACMSVHSLHVPIGLEEGIQSSGTGVTDSQLPCECRDLNPGPLEEQHRPLTTQPSRKSVLFSISVSSSSAAALGVFTYTLNLLWVACPLVYQDAYGLHIVPTVICHRLLPAPSAVCSSLPRVTLYLHGRCLHLIFSSCPYSWFSDLSAFG